MAAMRLSPLRIALFLSFPVSTLFAYACGSDSSDTGTGAADAAPLPEAATADSHAEGASDDGPFDSAPFDDGSADAGADASEGGSIADAAPDVDAGPWVVGTLGDPCAPVGALGCAGHAQKGQLICGVDHQWASNGVCAGAMNCDTAPGSNAGSCQPIAAGCDGLAPGDSFCTDGGVASQCGPDLVTRVDSVCAGVGNSVCLNGHCAGCLPGTPATCSFGGVQRCDDAGVISQKSCQFGCVNNPWASCADCAEGTFRCLTDAGTGAQDQACVNGTWEEPVNTTCSPECTTTNWTYTNGILSSTSSTYDFSAPSNPVENYTSAESDCDRHNTPGGLLVYRLPTVQELQSILYKVGTCNPAVDQGPFGDTRPGPNWTMETVTSDAGALRIRTVDMTTGAVSDADPSESHGSRCRIW
jgi:hypothetical protein